MNEFLAKIVDVGERRALFEEILGLIKSGEIAPTVEKSFDLSEFATVLKAQQEVGRTGKFILTS